MQADFLEQTIRSVLLQGYPDIEYYVLDGGSTDGSAAIIEKYAPWLAGWRNEKDAGQTAAINEGWAKATGEIVAWLNSDDWYHPGALFAVAEAFSRPGVAWVAGAVDDCDAAGAFMKRHPAKPTPLPQCLGRHDFGLYQPGMFWARALVGRVGPLDASMHFAFDNEFWARCLLAGATMEPVAQPVACFRRHGSSKTLSRHEWFLREDWAVFRRFSGALSARDRRRAAAWLRAYEADTLPNVVYRMLADGNRLDATLQLMRRIRILASVRPRKLVAGLLFRTLIAGRPPEWFRRQR
jgi:glycosyltransferase involved in cell wall biosynthesis